MKHDYISSFTHIIPSYLIDVFKGMIAVTGVTGSSLIGVAIACAGNVLISLALTIQKLAHRQLSEQHERFSNGSERDDPANRNLRVPQHNSGLIAVSLQDDDQSSPSVPVVVLPQDGSLGVDGKASKPQTRDQMYQSEEPENDDIQQKEDSGVEEGAYLKSKLWWIGLMMISIGEGGNFLSYAFAPASVVAPLGTVALVANCIFAPLILKERFRPKELIGMGLAILGAVTVVYASNDTNPRLNPSELLQAISQLPFLIYTLINILFLLILIFLSRSSYGPKYTAIDVGVCAIFGGYTVLATKAMASLLSTMFLVAFEYPVTWGLVIVLVGTSIAQVKYLNKAMMHSESKEVIPTQFVFFSLAAIVGSAVLYQEFRDVTISRFVNFAFGIGTTFFGVYLLTSAHQSSTPTSSPPDTSPSSSDYTPSPSPRHNHLINERTPLLIPSTAVSPSSPNTLRPIRSPAVRSIRLLKRNSTGEISTLGLNSQAGFLLLATTPPPTAAFRQRREGSTSRAERGEGHTRRVSDGGLY